MNRWSLVSEQLNPPKILPSQEAPSVGVEGRSDYLRSGNVKPDDQSLGLPDQEEG